MVYLDRRLCGLEEYKRICGEIAGYCGSLSRSVRLQGVVGEVLCDGEFISGRIEGVCSEKELIENIRTVAEVLIWEDQNEEQGFFDTTCEFGIFPSLVELVICMEVDYMVRRQSLQTLSIILQNLRNMNTLYYMLSNNVISRLLNRTFRSGIFQSVGSDFSELDLNITTISKEEEEEDELLSYYVALLRTLALRLNGETLRLFVNEKTEFPLWRNACMYINHRDSMVRNTSRSVLLNILRKGEKEVIDYILLEEVRQLHHQGRLEQAMRHLDMDPDRTRDLLRSLSSEEGSSVSLVQSLVSSLVKQVHQLGELAENLDFGWPEIEEYMGIVIRDQQELSRLEDGDDGDCQSREEPQNVSPIGPTSPITLSYAETESADGYSSPVVNHLNPTFYDHLIRPLERQVELILDTMDLFHEFVLLKIRSISWLFCNSVLHQVFEMVLFQKIANELVSINQGTSRNNTILIKIHLFITHLILSFLYSNNQGGLYDVLISNIWEKFLKLGNQQSLFGNTFSTLINYLEEDSELVLMFGLLNLHSIWGKILKREEGDESSPEITAPRPSPPLETTTEKRRQDGDEEVLGATSGFLQSVVNSLSSLFHQRDGQESLLQEICRARKTEHGTSLVEVELVNSMSPSGYSSMQRHKQTSPKRCKSLPRNWKCGQDDENSLLKLEASKSLMKACIHQKRLRIDLEGATSKSEFLFRQELQTFYSKLNCEILSQDPNNQGPDCLGLLLLAQFLEKLVLVSEKNNYSTKTRPLCMLATTFLALKILQDHETLRRNDHFRDILSLLDSFIKYFKNITLRRISDLLRRDLNTGDEYAIFDDLGNLNYMVCEHFLEWRDEDQLLIRRLFERHEAAAPLAQGLVSNVCILPQVRESTLPKRPGRYIWNLIDTYPIFRWFPNSCRGHHQSAGQNPRSKSSVFLDHLRSNYNNMQILETLCEKLKAMQDTSPRDLEDDEAPIKNGTETEGGQCSLKTKIVLETKPYKVSVIRAKKTKTNHYQRLANNVQCSVIFDLNRGCLVLLTGLQLTPKLEKKPIMLASFEITRCKPVPIMTRPNKTATRHLVALLVRYRKYELEEHVVLDDFLYELPLREDLLSSPNISKGAIIQPRETKVNKRIYHLNNLLLPAYTRVGLDSNGGDSLGKDLSFSDYALYMEFESKKKSQEFIKKLNELRRERHVDALFEEYANIFR